MSQWLSLSVIPTNCGRKISLLAHTTCRAMADVIVQYSM